MALLIFVLFFIGCRGTLPSPTCPIDGKFHSLFFMSVGFSGTPVKYIEPTSDLCVCNTIVCNTPLQCFPSSCSYESDKVYRVKSNKDVYGIMENDSLGEMFHALKDEYLGSEYVASVYFDVTGQSFIGVGNPSDSEIIVNIALPEVNNYSLTECMNKTITVNLQSLEATTLNFNCDITGAYINASGNIIAYVASFSSVEPNTASNHQFMVEQLIPINQWGTRYAVVPYGINAYGDIITIVTFQPDTFVHISGYDHVIIPKEYENIRRRIDGKKPVRIRSSKPVSVTQFVLNAAHKSVMVINIPVTLNTDTSALKRNSDFNYFYMNMTYDSANDNNAPLTYFNAYRGDLDPPTDIFGCNIYKDESSYFGGTFCGFLQNEDSNERHWPLMVPGDGIDNDGNGQTDENDCYGNFWEDTANPYLSSIGVLDCKKNVAADIIKEIFIMPRSDDSTLTVKCRIEPQDNADLKYWVSTPSAHWQSLTSPADGFYHFDSNQTGKPLIIKTKSSNKLSLMCYYVRDDYPWSNSFVVPPVSELGTEYTTIFPTCHGNSQCDNQCIVGNVFNGTSVSHVRGTQYRVIPLGQNLAQQTLHEIIDRSYIGASYPVAVVCASFNQNSEYLVHFLPPVTVGGSEYKVIKTKHLEEEQLVFVATDGNTIVNLSGNENQASGSFRQHFLLQDAGDQNKVDLTLDNSDFVYSFSSSKPVHVIAEFRQNSSYGPFAVPPFSIDGYNFVYLPPVSNILTPTDGTSISERVSGTTYYYLSNSGWPHRSNDSAERNKPIISRYQIPGDGIDNDKDGLTDEEYCGFIVEENPSEERTLHDLDLDGSYNEDCKGCQGGQELTQDLICLDCDFGTYRENRSKIDKCLSCGENFTTFEKGTFSMDHCIPVCIEGMELNDTMCEPCRIGYFKNLSAYDTSLNKTDRFRCKQCPVGLTTYDVGTVAEEDCIDHCEEGEELREGTCKACDIGFYKTLSSTDLHAPIERRWNCTACENNRTTIDIGSVEETKCIDNCVEGMFLNGTLCFPCPVGFFKNSSSKDYSISSHLRWNCTECESGKTTYSTGSRECIDHCGNGQYLKNGTCTPCDVGFYKNTSSEDESLPESLRWTCTQCPAGETTNSTGAENCIKTCPIGKEYNGTTRNCDPCSLGSYKNVSGSHIDCYNCPENYTTRHTGAVSFQDCKLANCKCPCDRVHEVKNYTSNELAKIIDEMKKELTVNKAHLSATVRKKISVMDRRPSVQYIGSFGVILITVIFALLIGFDLVTLKEHLKMFFKNLKSIF